MSSTYQRYTNQLVEIKALLAQAKDSEVIERLHELAREAVEYLEVPFEYVDGNGNHGEVAWEDSSWSSSGCEWESSNC